MSDPRVVEHQVTLRFVCPNPEAIKLKDEEVVLQAMTKIPGWSFIDQDDIECERFSVYQPEFDTPEPLDCVSDNATIWQLTFGCTHAMSMHPTKLGEEPDVVTLIYAIRDIVAITFPTMKYIRATEYKKFEFSTTLPLPY